MAECLNCHKELNIEDRHHGTIFTCPHCNAVFFCGWDGALEMAQHVPETEIESVAAPVFEPAPESPAEVESSPALDSAPDFESAHLQEPTPKIETEPGLDSTSEYQNVAEPEVFAPASDVHSPNLYATDLSVQTKSFAEDVNDFANNNDVSITDVSYRLVIEGIDTAQIHETFVEAITDSRFGWDKNDILAKVKNGKLELRNLTPAKTSVLVNRIKHLEVVIRWYYEA